MDLDLPSVSLLGHCENTLKGGSLKEEGLVEGLEMWQQAATAGAAVES